MAGKSCCGGASAGTGKPRIKTFTGTVSAPSPETAPGKSGGCCGAGNSAEPRKSCGCGGGGAESKESARDVFSEPWVTGVLDTPAGKIPRVATRLSFRDVWGSWKCRWSIGRMDYAVAPGLYGVGSPDENAPVLVTANYKMTFDRLRMELTGVSAWIVVLDTDGVNVWCAAGKGTFGTEELIGRIAAVGLDKVVAHRKVVVPQLGATGVAAHEVRKRSGFTVVFGPVRASDLAAFLAADMTATEAMRTVNFPIFDRLVLTPMEFVAALKPMIFAFGVLFLLNAVGLGHYGRADFAALLGAVLAGCVVTPVLLPFIPGSAFSFKGLLVGLIWALILNSLHGFPGTPEYGWLKGAAYFLIIPSLSAFCAMNFTGSSTFTSLSGVDREMRVALPAMLISTAAGAVLFLIHDFLRVFGR